jgi:hypothetical protein
VPAGHSVQTAAPAREYCPATHWVAVADVDPTGQEYPAVHAPLHVDDVRPADDPYDPAAHGPVQPDAATPTEDPKRPAGHAVHAALAVLLLNVPMGHCVQADAPAKLNEPAGQADTVGEVDPAGQVYPAVHWPEQAPDGRPVAAPKVPAGHSVQAPAPAREYCPATHWVAVAEVDPAGQAYPAVHAPLHVDDVRPGVAP